MAREPMCLMPLNYSTAVGRAEPSVMHEFSCGVGGKHETSHLKGEVDSGVVFVFRSKLFLLLESKCISESFLKSCFHDPAPAHPATGWLLTQHLRSFGGRAAWWKSVLKGGLWLLSPPITTAAASCLHQYLSPAVSAAHRSPAVNI